MIEHKSPWVKISAAEKYDNPWISVTEHQVLNPAGGPGIYGVVHFKNKAIGVITLDDALQVTLVGQFRFAPNAYSWEIPEGGGPLDSDPLEGAKRELLEETGLKAGRWDKILKMHLSNSVSDEEAVIFLARDLSQHEASPEDTEELQLLKVPFEKAYQLVCNEEITDAMSVAAILKLKLMMYEHQLDL